MARPTKIESQEKNLEKSYNSLRDMVLKERASRDPMDRLTIAEMAFAELVVSEGFTYTDAYVEVYKPKTENKDSIHQMSSRIAARPRVQAEMDRIRRKEEDDKLRKEERLAVALNPVVARERMAVSIYAMATGSKDEKNQLAAWKLFGSLKHIDAFTGTTSTDRTGAKIGDFGLRQGSTANEAKVQLMDTIKKIVGSRIKDQVIEVKKDVGE